MRYSVPLLVVAAFASLFLYLGTLGLTEPSEGRYAEVGRSMAFSGDWVTPRLNGIKHFEKPPFAYWMVGIGVRLFGDNEFGVRCLAALFGVGTVLLTWRIGRRLWDSHTGVLAGAILLVMPLYVGVARSITTDVFLSFWSTLAAWCFVEWYADPARPARWRWGIFVALGFGMLTKGPATLVGGFLPAVLFLAWRREWGTLRALKPLRGLLVSSLFALPWLVLLDRETPGVALWMLLRRSVQSVVSSEEFHGEPIWYFFPVVLVGCIPVTPVLAEYLRRWVKGSAARPGVDGWSAQFLTFWWLTVFTIFSISASKLLTYILPICMPMALIGARTWMAQVRECAEGPLPKAMRIGLWCQLAFYAIGAVAVVVLITLDPVPGYRPNLDVVKNFCAARDPGIVLAAYLALGVPTLAWLLLRRRHRAFLVAMVVFLLGTQVLALRVWQSLESEVNTLAPMGRQLRAELRPGDVVVSYLGYPRGLSFYLGRPVPTIDYEKRNVLFVREEAATREINRFGRDELLKHLGQPYRYFMVMKWRNWWNDDELRARCREWARSGGYVTIVPKEQE